MEAKKSKKNKDLAIILLAMTLMGCGGMRPMGEATQKKEVSLPVESVLFNALGKGMISQNEADQIKEALMQDSIEITEQSPRALQMKLADMDVVVEFRENITNNPQDVVFTMNGVEVTNEIISNPEAFQYLIASVSSSKPNEEGGTRQASHHMEVGQKLVNMNSAKKAGSNLLGLILRIGLPLLAFSSPIGSLIAGVATPILRNYQNRDQQREPQEQGWFQNNGSNPNPSGRNHDRFYETEEEFRERIHRAERANRRDRFNRNNYDRFNRNTYNRFDETEEEFRERISRAEREFRERISRAEREFRERSHRAIGDQIDRAEESIRGRLDQFTRD